MHTKKTNNTNKLMQISYYSALTKIQKLQNFKKKKKNSIPTGIARNWSIRLVFKPVRNVDISISIYILVWYILAGMAGTDMVLTTLIQRPRA